MAPTGYGIATALVSAACEGVSTSTGQPAAVTVVLASIPAIGGVAAAWVASSSSRQERRRRRGGHG